MSRTVVWVVAIIALVGVGMGAGLGYGRVQLGKEQEAHRIRVNELHRKISFLEKKAFEAREARSDLDERNHALQAEVEKLGKENGEQAEQIKKFEVEAQASEAKLKGAAEEIARANAARNEVSVQLGQVVQTAKELGGQAKLLTTAKQTLEASLGKVNQSLDVCRSHNARLCIIADEMATRQKAGCTAGCYIRQNEPFTQVGKVELEKLLQEYKDKIEQEKLQNK